MGKQPSLLPSSVASIGWMYTVAAVMDCRLSIAKREIGHMNYVLWPDRPEIKHNLIREINSLDTGKIWDIEIKEYRKPKSVSQRGWFHSLCHMLGNELGIPEGQVKELAKAQILGWRVVTLGGITFPVADGSSEKLDRMEYSDLIEVVYRLGAEAGVVLPEANRFRKAG